MPLLIHPNFLPSLPSRHPGRRAHGLPGDLQPLPIHPIPRSVHHVVHLRLLKGKGGREGGREGGKGDPGWHRSRKAMSPFSHSCPPFTCSPPSLSDAVLRYPLQRHFHPYSLLHSAPLLPPLLPLPQGAARLRSFPALEFEHVVRAAADGHERKWASDGASDWVRKEYRKEGREGGREDGGEGGREGGRGLPALVARRGIVPYVCIIHLSITFLSLISILLLVFLPPSLPPRQNNGRIVEHDHVCGAPLLHAHRGQDEGRVIHLLALGRGLRALLHVLGSLWFVWRA